MGQQYHACLLQILSLWTTAECKPSVQLQIGLPAPGWGILGNLGVEPERGWGADGIVILLIIYKYLQLVTEKTDLRSSYDTWYMHKPLHQNITMMNS